MPRGRFRANSNSSANSNNNSRTNSFANKSANPSQGYTQQSRKNENPSSAVFNTQSKPSITSTGGGIMGGLGSTIVSGMAFGGGSEIAHQVVRSMMGGSGSVQRDMTKKQPHELHQDYQTDYLVEPTNTKIKQNPCFDLNLKFVDCLKIHDNNISSCQSLFDQVKMCEKNSSML